MARILLFASAVALATAACYDPSPAFPLPLWEKGAEDLEPAFVTIAKKLEAVAAAEEYDIASFSVEVTSNTETLWTHYHSAREHNETRSGVKHVDGDSQYRIASITKVFTTLGVLYQHAAGNLSLDDPVNQYLDALQGSDSGAIPWKDITLRIMASQLSGIPRETDQADLINYFDDPTQFGLPPASREGLPECYEYNDFKPCNTSELIDVLKKKQPIFAPNQKSTYSNANFELLGMVLSNVTGMDYNEYMHQSIFAPLNMTSTSLDKPSDKHGVIPLGPSYWDADEGAHGPTGGIYASSSDMSKFVRYIMTHFNALVTGLNWFMPASWATGINSFYGMPFEIFRTDAILPESKRPVTFVTKSGGVPGYFSIIAMMPEYGLGITILTAGPPTLKEKLLEIVTVELARAAEELIWHDVEHTYSGVYLSTDPALNSSLELASSPSTGLIVNSFISNGTDVVSTLLTVYAGLKLADKSWRAQLVPTLLYKNETTQQGEIWRFIISSEREAGAKRAVWDEECATDVDPASYAGLPVNEFVFWHDEGVVELPAWRVSLKHTKTAMGEMRSERLVVQQ